MSDVTVIGLGNMGSALAGALQAKGQAVTVWNRSPEKAASLVAAGAVLAPSAAVAIAASSLVIVCVTNYAAANQILGEAASAITGKLLVQLTTGSPQDARASEAWVLAHGAEYLEGAITGGPDSIGTPGGHILLSGSETTYRKAEPVLRLLAGQMDYKGEAIGLASAWEMVFITRYYGMFLSLFHSVLICQAEGIPLEEFITLLGEQGKNYEKWLCENIRSGNYQETSAPLELWAGAIQKIARHAEDSGIDAGFPRLAAGFFQKAMDDGFGREEVSALFKVLQKPG